MTTEVASGEGADLFDLPHLCRYFSERSPQPMIAVEGPTHIVRFLNLAFARLIGMAAADMRGRTFAEVVPEATGNGCLALLDRVLRTGAPANLAEQGHLQSPPAYWSYAMWAILGADERPTGVIIQITDATEVAVFRRQAIAMNEALVVSSVRQHELIDTIRRGEQERRALEAQMFQAQKLESLGVLAGGIAHDLNNMLAPVLGYAELASKLLPAGSSATPMLAQVVKHGQRAADLVQQILAYAGKGRFVVEQVNLSDLVREMDELLAAAVSTHAELAYDLAPALPLVEADATQIRQVIVNLVTNAAEASAAGNGVITVRTGWAETVPPAPSFAGPPIPRWEGPAVFLEVVDSGCGMAADMIEKIFDPFFTTKFTGRGLGLAVVQGIARGHGGALHVRSQPGEGSTFRLLLPCSKQIAAAPVVLPSNEHWQGAGTVLVIDDEEAIRNMAACILEQVGLTVLVAADGEEGVRLCRENQQGIDAVLLDLTMPKMGGLTAAQALHSVRPDLPVVLMSGFSAEEVTRKAAGLRIAGFVQKPFKLADLLAAVRYALQQ